MRYLPFLWLLLAAIALGQDQPAPSPGQPGLPPEYRPPTARDKDDDSLPASITKDAPDAAVITIHGVCEHPKAPAVPASSCQTTMTRDHFEKLTEALLKNMPPARKKQVANAYPGLLAMAQEAEARGLENSPRFQERLQYAREQILSQELVRQIEEDSAQVPDKDIADYYREHSADFATATLERVFVPNRKRMDPLSKDKSTPEAVAAQQKESEDAMTRAAEQLRAQAAAGDSFMALQKEAYAAAGLADVPPNPSLGRVHGTDLPPGHGSVFQLKPGEVSPVLSDSTGHYIYKVDARETESLSAASPDIRKILAAQRRAQAIEKIQEAVTADFNLAYFGPMQKSKTPAGPSSK